MKHPILTAVLIGGMIIVALPIIALAYMLIAKPFGIDVQNIPSAVMQTQDGTASESFDHPLLTTEQEQTLESVGVDTSTLPTSITPEQATCFTAALGAERVQELLGGAALSMTDVYKATACL